MDKVENIATEGDLVVPCSPLPKEDLGECSPRKFWVVLGVLTHTQVHSTLADHELLELETMSS